MLLSRIGRAVAAVTHIGELRAQPSLAALRHTGVTTLGYAAAALLATVSACGVLGAGYIVLARHLGPAEALAVISGVGLGLSAIVWLAAYRYGQIRAVGGLRDELSKEERVLRSTVGLSQSDEPASADGTRTVTGPSLSPSPGVNPMTLAAAGIAAAGLLGPSRLFRLIRIGVGVGSVAALITRAAREHKGPHSDVDARSTTRRASDSGTPGPSPAPARRSPPDNGAASTGSKREAAVPGR